MDAIDNVRLALAHAQAGHAELEKAARALSGGPSSYYFAKIEEYVNALFGKYAPFKVGDRVRLTAAPDTDNDWRSCAHFLVPGALATVNGVDYSKSRFVADVIFDNESWIDREGVVHLAENFHTFRIGEEIMEKVK